MQWTNFGFEHFLKIELNWLGTKNYTKIIKKNIQNQGLTFSLFSFKIELMEIEDILYGYTGKKANCKTQVWSPFFMSSFWKCMIELKI